MRQISFDNSFRAISDELVSRIHSFIFKTVFFSRITEFPGIEELLTKISPLQFKLLLWNFSFLLKCCFFSAMNLKKSIKGLKYVSLIDSLSNNYFLLPEALRKIFLKRSNGGKLANLWGSLHSHVIYVHVRVGLILFQLCISVLSLLPWTSLFLT